MYRAYSENKVSNTFKILNELHTSSSVLSASDRTFKSGVVTSMPLHR